MADSLGGTPPRKAVDDDGVLARLVSYYEDSVTATFVAREKAERDRDYYDNEQWTADEKAKLIERGQAPIVINRIKPKIDFLLGTERQSRTDPQAFPRNPQDEDSAEAATDALRYVADCNDFDQCRSDAFENVLIEGTGAAIVEVEAKNKIKIRRIWWDRLFFDPHSRARDFSDALYMGIVVWMDKRQVLAKYPDGGEEVWCASADEGAGSTTTYGDRPRKLWLDSNRSRLKICETYYLDGDTWMRCVYTCGGYLEKPAVSAYLDEDGVPLNPICAISAHIDRDNNRYGVVRQLIGVQDEINKRRSKALHLISTRQFQMERGAVDNVVEAKRELAKPDGMLQTNPGLAFQLLDTSDMAQGNLALLAEAKAEIDAVGANAALQGKQQGDASGRALQSRQQSGLLELGPVFDALRHWQRLVYRQVWYRVKQYWREPMWVRVTDDEDAPQYVGINQPTTIGDQYLAKAKKDGATPEQLQHMAQQMLADPARWAQPATQNEVARMDMDIIIAEAPDTVNLQGEQFDALTKMYQASLQSPDPKDHIPFEIVLEASSLRGKAKLLAKLRGDDDDQAQQQRAEQAQKAAAMQDAAAQAELAAKQADAQLKQAQAVKTMKEAQMTMPETGEPAVPDAIIKAESDKNVALIQGHVELEKTRMQAEAEAERHAMSLTVDHQKAQAEHERMLREQDVKAAELSQANNASQIEGVMSQLQDLVQGLQNTKADKADENSQVLVKGLTAAIQALGKPKRVVRGSDGRVNGIE